MVVGVQVLKGVSSHMTIISLNEDLARIEEAGTIEDENQEHQINNKDILKDRVRNGPAFFCPTFDICYISGNLNSIQLVVISYFKIELSRGV